MAERMENPSDILHGTITYRLANGRFVKFDKRLVQEVGIAELLRAYGEEMPTERQPVFKSGRKIGTVAADFEPMLIKSKSFFYTPRGGDFTWEDGKWVADRMLGPGDFEAIPGFRWERENPGGDNETE